MERMKRGSAIALTLALAAAGAVVASGGCGKQADAPEVLAAESAVAARAAEQLVLHCSSCHGVQRESFTKVQREAREGKLLRWPVGPDGRIAAEDREAVLATCSRWLDPESPLIASPLLRATLPRQLSGVHHVTVFDGPEDPDFLTLAEWAASAMPAPRAPAAPSEAAQFFAERVVPILSRKTCLGAGCHGTLAFNDLRMDSGMPLLGANPFTPAMHRENRRQMLGAITRLVNLGGDPRASRQLQKCIPVDQGGIVHKGGNNFLEPGDPDFAAFTRWLELESAEALARSGLAAAAQEGWLFVRRPRATPERFFEDAGFLPGGDLWWRSGGEERNLTAALHPDGPADVRAPDLSYDGERVVFAMRRSAAEPFNLWELDLADGSARQLTFSADPLVHCLDPLWVPDPADAGDDDLARANVVFVTNRAGEWCQSSPEELLGQAVGGRREEIHDPQRSERAGALVGRRLRILFGAGAGAERTVIANGDGVLRLDRPLDAPPDQTTHYVIACEPRMAPKYDAWLLPYPATGAQRAAWEEGARRMTWSASQIRRPTMRSSGEVMFTCLRTGWQDGRPFFNGALFRVHVDGSNFHTHNGNRSGVPIFADDRELPNGHEIRIGRDADSWWGGTLILSDHQFGPTIELHNPLDDLPVRSPEETPAHSLTEFAPGWIELDDAADCRGVSPGGAYRDPYPLPDGSILVSWAPGPVDLHDPLAAPDFDVVRLVPEPSFQSLDGARAGTWRRETVIGGAEAELWARPVMPRLKYPTHKHLKTEPGLLGEPREEAGYARYPEGTPALVEIYDLPLLAAFFEQITPLGVKHLGIERCPICGEENGEVDRITGVRLVGALPQGAADRGAPRRALLAEHATAHDGSAYLALPSGMPFDIQALNPLGMSVTMPNRWLYCHPGERHTLSIPRTLFPQTCGGCHGALTGKRADSLVLVDAVTAASRTLAVWDKTKGRKTLPMNWSGGVPAPRPAPDFDREIRPVLERKCAFCHAEFAGPGAYAALLPHVEHREAMAVKSYLFEKLLGRELHAPRALSGETPHPRADPLTAEELRALILWVDLGAAPGERPR